MIDLCVGSPQLGALEILNDATLLSINFERISDILQKMKIPVEGNHSKGHDVSAGS